MQPQTQRAGPGMEPGASVVERKNMIAALALASSVALHICKCTELLRELNPGPLVPEARFIPPNKAARCGTKTHEYGLGVCHSMSVHTNKCKGLLRELNPGPLAPKARIIPVDKAASCEPINHDCFVGACHPKLAHTCHPFLDNTRLTGSRLLPPSTQQLIPCGTRSRNLRIRNPTPCPLGQGG